MGSLHASPGGSVMGQCEFHMPGIGTCREPIPESQSVCLEHAFPTVVRSYLEGGGTIGELASEFECIPSTVRRWSDGAARPMPGVQKLVTAWIRNRSK